MKSKKSSKTSRSRLFPTQKAKPWKLIALGLVGVGVIAAAILLTRSYAAGNATLTLSSASVEAGSNVTVDLRMNSGSDPVNVVHTSLTYPTDKLEFVGIDSTNSALSKCVEHQSNPIPNWCTGGNGKVTIVRYADPESSTKSISGDKLIARVTFKALASSGTATVSIDNGSIVARSTDSSDILGGKTNSTITFSGGDTEVIGDVNGDGRVTIGDISIILNSLRNPPATVTRGNGDLNGDGKITIGDVSIVTNALRSL